MTDEAPPPVPAARPLPPPRRNRAARLLVGISVVGLVTLVAGGVGAWFVLDGRMAGGGVKDESVLELRIDGDIADAPGHEALTLDAADFPPLLTEITADLRRAAADERITGLYLDVEDFPLGWASASELRGAIADFAASGKSCWAYADAWDDKTYYVASPCAELYVAPAGLILVNGFAITTQYYAGTFEKIGVHANFEHVGEFKSAVEPMVRSGPSEPASQAVDEMLDSLHGEFVRGIASGRGVEAAVAAGWVDDPPLTPEASLAAGMITGVKHRDVVREELAGKERTPLGDYHEGSSPLARGKAVAIVHAEGAIVSGDSDQQLFGGRMVGDRSMRKLLSDLREDEDVAAVVLRVNSPGGSGLASDNIWRELERLKAAEKPIVVSMGDYAASGGYYIAAPADWIVAQPGTLTGSIGVFGGKINLAGAWENLGVTSHTWQRGRMAMLLSPMADFSEEERGKFKSFLQSFYDVFLDRVASGRDLERADVDAIAQGRVWTGEQALERKLVDELGGLDEALARARELAHLGDDVRIERFPKRRTFLEQIMDDLENRQARAAVAALPEPLRSAWADASVVARVLEGTGVAAMLPFVVRED